jgi:release factor glutamine methyltransferase
LTVREALSEAEARLAAAGVPTPRVDAELLVAHVLGTTRSGVYAEMERAIDGLEPLLARREAREPLAYVLGEWGFRRLTLTTDRRALVPRPETEVVVERALAVIRGRDRPRVLDIGVGSGAIALAIADEHPGARVTGVDVSSDALALARENAERLAIAEDLEPELRYEPSAALVGRGLHAEIARAAETVWLVLETGDGQARDVAAELAAIGYREITITCDLAGEGRVVEGRR